MEEYFSSETIALISSWGMNIIGVLLLLLVAWIMAGWARRAVRQSLETAKFDPTLTKFFSNLARYAILVIAAVSALGVFGIQATSFAAVLAAAGLAIGLAFQGTLSNFAAGVMLLTFRPFQVGDVVTVAGQTGKINELELFSTSMDTPDNRRIIVPNSAIFGSTIENITFHDTRRVDISVGTDYGADLAKTRGVLETVANAEEARLPDRDIQVYLGELGDSSINWKIRVWTKTVDYWAARERLTTNVKNALDEAGIGIPFPQMDVHLNGKLDRA